MIQLTAEIIQGFTGSILGSRFDNQTTSPACHLEWWDLCTSKEKYVAIAAPRGHAKTTAVTLAYGLATLLFRNKKYVIVVSDTESQACQFLGSMKQELSENKDLIKLFGIKLNEKGETDFIKDTESDFICAMNDGHMFRVQAKGSEQKLRGLLWNGQRPDLILGDDLENDEIVLNQDRREKFRKWFYGALVPCLSATGQIRIVGTILHADAALERLMPQEHDKQTVVEDLKIWSKRTTGWKAVKYRAHSRDYTKILWPERWSKEKLQQERQNYVDMGLPDVYSREFLNIPIDDSVAFFKKGDFLPMGDEDRKARMNYYIAADLAISEKERADYSVFVVGGVDEAKRIHIVNVIRERMDGREIVDTVLALQRAYEPEGFGIEEGQISKAIGPFLMEEMHRLGTYANIIPMKHMSQDKPMRARAIQARMRAKTVKFDKQADWFPMLEEEMTRFPRDRHDDQVDAMAWLGHLLTKMVEAHTDKEQRDIEYEDELEKSDYYGPSFDGRNATTGY